MPALPPRERAGHPGVARHLGDGVARPAPDRRTARSTRSGVGDLAARLGLGERQLRRLFTHHLGAGPLAIARTRRVHFAAELLAQTDWPVSRVALASGFTSLRRFNEAIRDTFHRAPRELRQVSRSKPKASEDQRGARRAPVRDAAAIRLPYRAPFDAAGLLAYLAARAVPGVECVGDGRVRRALRIAGRRSSSR